MAAYGSNATTPGDPQSKQGGGISSWEPRSWPPKRMTEEELRKMDMELLHGSAADELAHMLHIRKDKKPMVELTAADGTELIVVRKVDVDWWVSKD